MPNHPERHTNISTQAMLIASKNTFKYESIGSSTQSDADGAPHEKKSASTNRTRNIAIIRNSSILDCLIFIVLFSYFYYFKCFVQKEYSFVFDKSYEECTYSYRQDTCEAYCNESEPASSTCIRTKMGSIMATVTHEIRIDIRSFIVWESFLSGL